MDRIPRKGDLLWWSDEGSIFLVVEDPVLETGDIMRMPIFHLSRERASDKLARFSLKDGISDYHLVSEAKKQKGQNG